MFFLGGRYWGNTVIETRNVFDAAWLIGIPMMDDNDSPSPVHIKHPKHETMVFFVGNFHIPLGPCNWGD